MQQVLLRDLMLPHARFGPQQIETVVKSFYAKVRTDADLAPIFAVHVTDWPAHEAKIARFWRNAILRDPVYSGNPMQKHRAAGNVAPEHFARWLQLFDEALAECMPPDLAGDWSVLAHRIGHSLKLGLEMSRVPRL